MEVSSGRVENARRALATVAVLVTVHYLYWRYTATFNPRALLFSWSLFAAEAFGFVTTILFYFTAWRPRRRTAAPPLAGRTVDVFVPTKNEPVAVLRTTLLACKDLRYPHRVLVLDDGGRPEVDALCRELGCVYLARHRSDHAKAGNLNFGLEHSDAEFVALFDADHVPLPHFIDRLIGYFADARVGFVQVPQEFYNIDSIQHRADRRRKTLWAEQHLFFSVIQPGRDAWNAAMFVGSCALLRRSALDDVGGFATGSITEDMLTSIRIHARGWSSVYHHEALAYGIAAQTLEPFNIQRQRWGVGNWQVFLLANPIFIKGLTLPQRLCYLASMIYPLEGLQKAIYYATPPVALVTGILPMRALDASYVLHFVPYFVLSLFAFDEMARGTGGQVLLEQYSMARYFTYLKTLVLLLVPGRRKVFRVTPKTEGKRRSPSLLVVPQALVLLASFASVAWGLTELLRDRRADAFVVAVNCFWALFNSGLALTIIQLDRRKLFQRRARFRIPEAIPAVLRPPGNAARQRLAVAEDLTENGAAILALDGPALERCEISFLLPGRTLRVECDAIRRQSIRIGPHTLSRIGVRFRNVSQEAKDHLSRHLHQAAVSRFMKEFRSARPTYLERRFSGLPSRDPDPSQVAAFPAILRNGPGDGGYGVVKDLSDTSLRVITDRGFAPGTPLTVDVALGDETVSLPGRVVGAEAEPHQSHPAWLAAIRLERAALDGARKLAALSRPITEFAHGDGASE
jgi:cellulose synthase (UDP-forming)